MQYWGMGYRDCGAIRRARAAFLKNPKLSNYQRNAGMQRMIACACKGGDKPTAKRLLKQMTDATMQLQVIDTCKDFKVGLLP
jgi:hypothetical protein